MRKTCIGCLCKQGKTNKNDNEENQDGAECFLFLWTMHPPLCRALDFNPTISIHLQRFPTCFKSVTHKLLMRMLEWQLALIRTKLNKQSEI